ncbi:MAG: TAXI family TRAP transporter solute-binding subunit [Oscillospiraceae bacterium]
MKIARLVCLLLACVLALCACSNAVPKTQKEPPVVIRFATGGSTGTYFAYGTALAHVLEDSTGYEFRVQSTGASKNNIMLVAAGDVELALAQNDVLHYAHNGTYLFDGEKIPGLEAIGACYTEVCQIVASSDIDSIDELAGARVSVGEAGSGVEFNARQILEAYGLSFSDITVKNLDFGASASALEKGDIEAFFCTAGMPTFAISALAKEENVSLLGIDDVHAANLIGMYPFFTRYTIPAGSYDGMDEEVVTVAVKATLIAPWGLPEDVTYNITKALFEGAEELAQMHPKGVELSPQFAVEGLSIPLHPGAEKYYKEVGVLG